MAKKDDMEAIVKLWIPGLNKAVNRYSKILGYGPKKDMSYSTRKDHLKIAVLGAAMMNIAFQKLTVKEFSKFKNGGTHAHQTKTR